MSQSSEFETFSALLEFRDSKKSLCKEEVRAIIARLESTSDSLCGLAERWQKVKTTKYEIVNLTEPQCKETEDCPVQEDGSPFVEEIELRIIGQLTCEIRDISHNLLEKIAWLETVGNALWKSKINVHGLRASGEVSGELLFMLYKERDAYDQFQNAVDSLKEALDTLESIDFSQENVHFDLLGAKFSPVLLKLVSEKVEGATRAASMALVSIRWG